MTATELKQTLNTLILEAGASSVGFAKAEPTDDNCTDKFSKWIASGCNAEMHYLENYPEIRHNPQLLLDNVKTIISVAFPYYPPQFRDESLPLISLYAYGEDYHDVIRKRLQPICNYIQSELNGETRICIDSAPIHERYWAWKSGIGFQGVNGLFILPDKGSYFFLAEILTTLEIEPDTPLNDNCKNCGKCKLACPMGAISDNKTIDARKCLSYLTIECNEDWNVDCDAHKLPLYGCDICQKVCPHNSSPSVTPIEEFHPSEMMLKFDCADVEAMSEDDFRKKFKHSPIKRTKLSGLLRNASKIKK